jgi:hypothetical protein
VFVSTVIEAETRFIERAKSFDATQEEIEAGLWRLRRKSWAVLKGKIDEEVMEGNILLKLRENFEDKFRYDEVGVPRIWRPTDDIEGIYTKAKDSTLGLIPLLSRFRLSETYAPPDLPGWIGNTPHGIDSKDDEDLTPIGGLDEEDGKSLEEEMTILSEAKRQDLVVRFKKTADGVYVEAKRSAIGGVAQVPLYFYGLLLALGWNEIVTGTFRVLLLILSSNVANINNSTTESSILHLPYSARNWSLRHLHTQPMGANAANGKRSIGASHRGGKRKIARVPREFRSKSSSSQSLRQRKRLH